MGRERRHSFLLGLVIGGVASVLWERRNVREWSDAIERGDFEAAQTALRRFYFGYLPQWFRKPPPEDENGEGPTD